MQQLHKLKQHPFALGLILGVTFFFLIAAATGNIRWTQLRSGDRHGNGTQGQSSDGTGTSGNYAKFDANGNVTDGASSSALATTIASGTKALATSAISSAACATVATATATGTLTTDILTASFNGDPTAVTGFVPSTSGMLTIIVYPTADTANFKVCNNTASSITPGAITLNWRVTR